MLPRLHDTQDENLLKVEIIEEKADESP